MIATYRRPFLMLDITGRTKGYEMDVAGPADFSTRTAGALADLDDLDGWLPYCFDPAAERVLYAHTPDMARVLAAPFLYQGQYACADRLVSVPLERLLFLETAAMAPTFVLSISRCGSTLLSALLRHAGQPSASEPDIFTQVAALPGDLRARLGEAGRLALIRGSAAALARQIGAGVVIKLRDHCNEIALRLVEAVPEARMAFMLRERLTWAGSRHRAFNDPPAALADILRRGVMTLDALARGGHRPVLIWYEDLLADPGGSLARLDVAAPDPGVLAAALAGDAQAGTSVSRDATASRRLPEAFAAGFEAAWAAVCPRDVLFRNGLERLLPPSG
jgi:hypothetical protein